MVKVEVHLSFIRIYIKELLHLLIRRNELIGIQSYKNGHLSWVIEYEMKDKTITSEYDRQELWEDILKGLDAHHIF